ncbi:MAG: DNA polymerase IV [Acidobacteriota bacterium]
MERRRAETWPRVILHADMDAFFAAVEQRDRPELRGKPLLVGGTGNRGVVSTASYEARPFGCRSAMPMAQARRLCPQAVVLPPDFDRYKAVSEVVMGVFARFSPLVEPLSLDEAFLDMTGAEGLFGPPGEMGRRIRGEVSEATRGLTISVGLAPCKFVAKVASDVRKPDGLVVVPPGEVTAFLWPLDVSRLWGVGPKTREQLEGMGLRSIGDVAHAPMERLELRLGEWGRRIHELAWGVDDRPVLSERETKSIGAETTLEKDVVGEGAIRPHLHRAAAKVGRHLRAEGFLAGAVRVKLKTSGFRILSRQMALAGPTDSDRELERAAEVLLGQFDLTIPMRLVGMAAFDLSPSGQRPVQGDLFSVGDRERERKLDRTLDELRRRFGEDAVRWGGEEE